MVGDITYIRTWQGWRYLACVMDLSTKEIESYIRFYNYKRRHSALDYMTLHEKSLFLHQEMQQ